MTTLPDWIKKYQEKGRARKVTEKYLGKITPDGIVKPKQERKIEGLKEIELLKENYPNVWKEILVFSTMRLFHSSL